MSNHINDFLESSPKRKSKKKWWQKPSSIALFIFSVILILFPFLFDEVESGITTSIIIMLVRSVSIIVIWYYFISPLLIRIANKILSSKNQKYKEEIENIVNVFPNIKSIIKYSWNETNHISGIKRIIIFFDKALIHYLLHEKALSE